MVQTRGVLRREKAWSRISDGETNGSFSVSDYFGYDKKPGYVVAKHLRARWILGFLEIPTNSGSGCSRKTFLSFHTRA